MRVMSVDGSLVVEMGADGKEGRREGAKGGKQARRLKVERQAVSPLPLPTSKTRMPLLALLLLLSSMADLWSCNSCDLARKVTESKMKRVEEI